MAARLSRIVSAEFRSHARKEEAKRVSRLSDGLAVRVRGSSSERDEGEGEREASSTIPSLPPFARSPSFPMPILRPEPKPQADYIHLPFLSHDLPSDPDPPRDASRELRTGTHICFPPSIEVAEPFDVEQERAGQLLKFSHTHTTYIHTRKGRGQNSKSGDLLGEEGEGEGEVTDLVVREDGLDRPVVGFIHQRSTGTRGAAVGARAGI